MNKFLILLGSLLAFSFLSCNSDEEEDDLIDILEKEKIAIHEYLNTLSTPVICLEYYSKNGQLIDTVFIFNHDDSGEVARDSGWVLMDYDKYFLNGDKIDTTDPQLSDSTLYPTFTYRYGGPIFYRYDTLKKYDYVAEAFRHISVGEKGGEMIVPSILAGDKNNYGKTLHYKLKSIKLVDDIKQNEEELMAGYLTYLQPLDVFMDSPSARVTSVAEKDTITYTALIAKGVGDREIQLGDSVVLERSCQILCEVAPFQLETREFARDSVKILFNEAWQRNNTTGMIKGLQRLHEGDHAYIIVPYLMAYGVAGTSPRVSSGSGKQYEIPPFSTLTYEVKIHKVVPKIEENN